MFVLAWDVKLYQEPRVNMQSLSQVQEKSTKGDVEVMKYQIEHGNVWALTYLSSRENTT